MAQWLSACRYLPLQHEDLNSALPAPVQKLGVAPSLWSSSNKGQKHVLEAEGGGGELIYLASLTERVNCWFTENMLTSLNSTSGLHVYTSAHTQHICTHTRKYKIMDPSTYLLSQKPWVRPSRLFSQTLQRIGVPTESLLASADRFRVTGCFLCVSQQPQPPLLILSLSVCQRC